MLTRCLRTATFTKRSNLTRAPLLAKRFPRFNGNASVAVPLDVVQGNVVPRLILPLKSAKYSFPLRPADLFRQFVTAIRAEYPEAKEIVATDSEGTRLAVSTPISTLLKNGFNLRIDDKQYSVPATSHTGVVDSSVLNVVDVQDLCMKVYCQKIRKRLSEDRRHHITYSEYESWCTEYGMTAEQAKSVAQALHMVGDVLYFHNNATLSKFLFLSPTYVSSNVAKALNIQFVKSGHGEILKELESILPEYLALNAQKVEYDKAASRSADLWMKGAGVYLVAQFLILARMVWIDFNWDIMEPVTYFVTLGGTIVGYLFFVLFKVEYTYMALKDRQVKKQLRKLYLKNEFAWPRWNQLDQQVQGLVHELGGASLPKELAGVQLKNYPKE